MGHERESVMRKRKQEENSRVGCLIQPSSLDVAYSLFHLSPSLSLSPSFFTPASAEKCDEKERGGGEGTQEHVTRTENKKRRVDQ